MGRFPRAALLLVFLTACGVEELGDDDLEADPTLEDENAPDKGVGKSIAELVSFSCATHTDTGYVRGNPFTITLITVAGQSMEMATANALLTMSQAAEASGVLIRFSSPDAAFRTMARQQYYWGCYINKNCNGGSPAARPGWSNHQSGHAVDLNTANGAVFNWLNAHGASYGFRRTDSREKWHWEWWGGGNPHPYCGNCVCSSGTQTQTCGDCGKQTRACNGCQWNSWSACAGPDPAGGTQACDSGSKGVCEVARTRCIAGNLTCQPVITAVAEVCDGLDNDCNGEVDDGHPPIGTVVPAFAATLIDVSYPRTLKRGEHAMVWADFRNDGKTTWTRENLWLAAKDPSSQLYAADLWPSSNVAALLDHTVQPGEIGRFSFEVIAAEEAHGEINEIFTLQRADGIVVACPAGEMSTAIQMSGETEVAPETTPEGSNETATSGCGCASPGQGLFGLIALSLVGLRRRRG